jgi:hypothetical protein
MELVALENNLLKSAEGYKGTPRIKERLLAEAVEKGYREDEAEAVVAQVMRRLAKTESGRKGGALGKAHNPNKGLLAAIRAAGSLCIL